jgi:pre-mRNA-splicing factor 18
LRALELIEERVGDKAMGQNDFRKALEDVEMEERQKLAKGNQNDANKGKEKGNYAETQVDLTLIKSDPDKLYPVIYYALKKTLAEWGQWMDDRPGVFCRHLSALPDESNNIQIV